MVDPVSEHFEELLARSADREATKLQVKIMAREVTAQEAVWDALQRLGIVVEEYAKAADRQATSALAQAKALTGATWALVAATVVLALGTFLHHL